MRERENATGGAAGARCRWSARVAAAAGAATSKQRPSRCRWRGEGTVGVLAPGDRDAQGLEGYRYTADLSNESGARSGPARRNLRDLPSGSAFENIPRRINERRSLPPRGNLSARSATVSRSASLRESPSPRAELARRNASVARELRVAKMLISLGRKSTGFESFGESARLVVYPSEPGDAGVSAGEKIGGEREGERERERQRERLAGWLPVSPGQGCLRATIWHFSWIPPSVICSVLPRRGIRSTERVNRRSMQKRSGRTRDGESG